MVDLTRDRRVADLRVVGEQERLAQNDRQRRVAFEGQVNISRPRRGLPWHDAQVLIVRRHEDIARAEVNLVCSQRAAYFQETLADLAFLGDLEPRDEAIEELPSCLGGRR